MTDRAAKAPLPSITARPSAAEKARFTSLAERAGISESALALVAIRNLLDPDGKTLQTASKASDRVAATDRVTIRLRPGDGAAIARRATARGMKASAYIAAVVRTHVRASPPLPATELAAFKEAVEVLAGLGQEFARVARSPALTGPEREWLRKEVAYVRVVLAGLEQKTHDFAKAALIAWESRSD